MTIKFSFNRIVLLGGRNAGRFNRKKSNFDLTSRSAFSNNEEVFTSRSYAALLAKNTIPYFHKKVADNYIIIKKSF